MLIFYFELLRSTQTTRSLSMAHQDEHSGEGCLIKQKCSIFPLTTEAESPGQECMKMSH